MRFDLIPALIVWSLFNRLSATRLSREKLAALSAGEGVTHSGDTKGLGEVAFGIARRDPVRRDDDLRRDPSTG